jgi:predicted GNAT family acetyltransferase
MESDFEIKDNPPEKRYEATIEDSMVRIEYIKARNRIDLNLKEVPRGLEGKGIGSKLLAKV